MLTFLDTTWVPIAFYRLPSIISSLLSPTSYFVEPIADSGVIQQVVNVCDRYLEEWRNKSKDWNANQLAQAGMVAGFDPLSRSQTTAPLNIYLQSFEDVSLSYGNFE